MKTMTVQELTNLLLSKCPPNTPVFASWEGVTAKILAKNITLTNESGVDVIDINVEDYGDFVEVKGND